MRRLGLKRSNCLHIPTQAAGRQFGGGHRQGWAHSLRSGRGQVKCTSWRGVVSLRFEGVPPDCNMDLWSGPKLFGAGRRPSSAADGWWSPFRNARRACHTEAPQYASSLTALLGLGKSHRCVATALTGFTPLLGRGGVPPRHGAKRVTEPAKGGGVPPVFLRSAGCSFRQSARQAA